MKKVILVLGLIFVSQFGYTQEGKPLIVVPMETTNPSDENAIYNTAGIDVKPDFPGGIQEFYKFIGKNYKTPNVKNLKGKVFVMFVIEKDGSLTDIKVLRDIGHGTGEEAVRVLKECPKWLPGEQNGKKVRVLYSLPISIQLP
jgi:protein TonB